jgi:hypothetical protein
MLTFALLDVSFQDIKIDVAAIALEKPSHSRETAVAVEALNLSRRHGNSSWLGADGTFGKGLRFRDRRRELFENSGLVCIFNEAVSSPSIRKGS